MGVFWGLMSSNTPIGSWTAREKPWWWTLLETYHRHCQGILDDFTLRDLDGNPPPKSLWFDKKALDRWRKDREREREQKARRGFPGGE